MTVAQFSFWGNYLPRVYPTHLRGTGESFAANVGGRMIGTCAALVTTALVPLHAGRIGPDQAGVRIGDRRHGGLRHWFHRELLAARAEAGGDLPRLTSQHQGQRRRYGQGPGLWAGQGVGATP